MRRMWSAVGVALRPYSIGAKVPRLTVVVQVRVQKRAKAFVQRRLLDGRNSLHATVEVARHPIRGAQVELLVASVMKEPES